MQGLWYGDRRDRVKWGALIHLAKPGRIRTIVQVAYFRHGAEPMLQTDEGDVPLPIEVWNHFSDLRHIERLGDVTGKTIIVLDQPFDPVTRHKYIGLIVSKLKEIESPKIVFLDPDTGIEPKNAKPEHVTKQDIREIWAVLSDGDFLVIYQHADRTKTWRNDRRQQMSVACDNVPVNTLLGTGIASDVAMLWCHKVQ